MTRGSSADRATITQRVEEYNARIAAAVAAAQGAHGRKVQFTTDYKGDMATAPNASIGTYRFSGGDLSDIDCFHPKWNTGQRKLACAVWESWESVALGGGVVPAIGTGGRPQGASRLRKRKRPDAASSRRPGDSPLDTVKPHRGRREASSADDW